eukprot:CAMPEP_0177780334 /NCGR_PEP_ID=MMETSP0491_2-20121128/17138_1 /TAXON_ID=63592 /ORGANISM="Tetraselmis chuii, Strain PLY429" /LENGTH=216 /DNA_ID=CAMNT_0019300079 /DNA_START=42 /DNA_END=692 /DNA_ORIENTATION=-
MAAALCNKAMSCQLLAARPAPGRAAPRASLVVRATSQQSTPAMSRRAAASLLALPAALVFPGKGLALIPDDDDEELVMKAKANRAARIKEDRQVDKEFLNKQGIVTGQQNTDLVPVQKAIAELAKSGSQLEAGNLSEVASTIGGSWLSDFKSAAMNLSTSDAAKASVTDVLSSIESLQNSAKQNKMPEAKRSFVSMVNSLQAWTSEAGVADKLRGL